MLLTRWEPFDITSSRIEREFNDIVNRFLAPSTRDGYGMSWRPAMEVFRDGDELVVRTELPGIDPDKDVEVSIEGNVLHVMGHRSFDREVSDENRHVVERAYGEFRREVTLPDGIDPDQVKADYNDGILTVTVPLPESIKAPEPRRIPVAASKVKKLLGGKKKSV